jgi:two-component system sensor histidine kinase VicK
MDTTGNFLAFFAGQTKDIVFVFDYLNLRFTFISPSIKNLLGLSQEEINQDPQVLLNLIAEEDRQHVVNEATRLTQEATTIDIEFKILITEMELRWFRLKAFSLSCEEGEGRFFAGMAEDISKRKAYELSLLAIKEQKNITIQVLGHDLRAPLNTISLSISLINAELNLEENEKARMLIEIMERTCRNSLDMIREVIAIEYNETQELGIKKTRSDIASRIQNQIDTFQLLDKSGKTFLFYKNTETIFANTDSIRLMLILENLLTNAYKFTNANGRIEVSVEDQAETVLIKVADNGIGIPDKLKPLIFDKFTKARRKGVQGEQTVGLGMHLIKTMVEQLEGKIWFESQEGVGTTFFVELPK